MKIQSPLCAATLSDLAARGLCFLALLFTSIAAAPAAGQQCSPASGGSPCETASGVASLGDPDGVDLTVGNPIHPVTGNKYQEEVDAPALPGFLGLEIRRHFNSNYVSVGSAWGRGWSVSYDTRLYRSGKTLQIVQADGRRLVFRLPDGTLPAQAQARFACASAAPGQGQLFAEPDGYRWVWPHQRELYFNLQGNLIRVGPLGGTAAESLRIVRSTDDSIKEVIDPAGRSMRFEYDNNGFLSRIYHPLGEWRYQVDSSGRVKSVTAPDQTVRRYRYDDVGHPARFTAITIARLGALEQMVGQWNYDAQGRAVGYRRADGSELRMTYDHPPQHLFAGEWVAPGDKVSVLTNALGGRTRFTARELSGKWRVTEIRGPGCEECGVGNIRMRYDLQGHLLARWKIGGEGLAYERDRLGRVVRIMRIAEGSASAPSSPDGRQYLQRLEYPDDHTSLPRLIASPSVIPGREHRVLIERNSRGNPVQILREGFAPDVTGAPGAAPVTLSRTSALLYRQVGDRQVLVQLDGPLPNGAAADPSDSDVTHLTHDRSDGLPSRITMPGGTTRSFVSRDPGGRPLVILVSDGYREVEERRVYNLRGDVLETRVTAWLLDSLKARKVESAVSSRTRRRFDIHGRLQEVTDTAGRVIHYDRDSAGRLRGVRDARGFRTALARDAEGQLLVAALHQPGVDEPYRATYFDRNQDGRLESLLLPDGRRVRMHYDAGGAAIGFSDAAGRLHLISFSAPPGASGSSTVDDFGQVLRQELPDHGARTMRYDAAGRMVGVTDAGGIRTGYRYDAADRLLARFMEGGAARVDYFHEGRLLVGVDDPGQTVRYRLDALGRVIRAETSLAGLGGAPLLLATSYDGNTGLVEAYGLAGGQSLRLRRGPVDEGALPQRLDLQSPFWSAAAEVLRQWLPGEAARLVTDALPRTTVVRDIRFHPFDGLAGFIHGNGTTMSRQFDRAGRTVRLRVGSAKAPVADWHLGYGVGPRLLSISEMQPAAASAGAPGLASRSFAYDAGGRLTGVRDRARRGVGTEAETDVAMRIPSSARRRSIADAGLDQAGRVIRDERFLYAYTPSGQVGSVRSLRGNRLVAAYAYNHRFQRIRKTVYDEHGKPTEIFYLWNDNRLVAEIDPDGRIVAQYLSLDGVRGSMPVARLQPGARRSPGSDQQLMAVHADYRGAPVALSDERQQLSWQAALSPRGQAEVAQQRAGTQMNLRLPGQYWDAETGLHDNWHRSYDPRSGLYLQPDPLGYPDGPDAYVYAGGDPVNRIDPTGLYQIDVHYYMTFFLGVTAGLDPQEARIVALAAQYVDDNPLTRPVDPAHLGSTLGSVFSNQRQLLGYHFVLSGSHGQTLPAYRNNRLDNPDSPQLQNLLNAAQSRGIGRNASLQFLGEYLHALADTYSHRDAGNLPYDALMANCGVGHGHALHEPDLTYDDLPAAGPADEGRPPPGQAWLREPRTLAMELDLHGVLLTFGDPAKARSFQEIEAVLQQFNGIRESGEGRDGGFPRKIALLQSSLAEMGFGFLDLGDGDGYGYNERDGRSNRMTFLSDAETGAPLHEDDFPGTCLQGGARCIAR